MRGAHLARSLRGPVPDGLPTQAVSGDSQAMAMVPSAPRRPMTPSGRGRKFVASDSAPSKTASINSIQHFGENASLRIPDLVLDTEGWFRHFDQRGCGMELQELISALWCTYQGKASRPVLENIVCNSWPNGCRSISVHDFKCRRGIYESLIGCLGEPPVAATLSRIFTSDDRNEIGMNVTPRQTRPSSATCHARSSPSSYMSTHPTAADRGSSAAGPVVPNINYFKPPTTIRNSTVQQSVSIADPNDDYCAHRPPLLPSGFVLPPSHPSSYSGVPPSSLVGPPASPRPQLAGVAPSPTASPGRRPKYSPQSFGSESRTEDMLFAGPRNPCDPALLRQGRQSRALLIGINYFGSPAALRGCVNDVRNIYSLLTQTFGWPRGNIKILTDEDGLGAMPTRANILDAFRWLCEGARPGHISFFHFSGHGAQQKDPHGYEEDGMNETILPSDFTKEGMISDDLIGEVLVRRLPENSRLIAVMDCCHSGTGLDLPFTWNGRSWSEETNPYHVAADVQLFSGCDDSETSAEVSLSYTAPSGAMTTAFCDVLRMEPCPRYPDLMEKLTKLLHQRGFSQHAQLTSSQAFDFRRQFVLTDIAPNSNPNLGRTFRRKFPPKPRRVLGPLKDVLLTCSIVFGGFVAIDTMAWLGLSAMNALIGG